MYMKANLSFQSKRFAGFLFFGLFIFLLFLSLFLALCNVWIWQESLAEANLVGKADIFIFRDLIWANVEKCLLSQGFLSQPFYSCAPPEGFAFPCSLWSQHTLTRWQLAGFCCSGGHQMAEMPTWVHPQSLLMNLTKRIFNLSLIALQFWSAGIKIP